MKKSKSQEKNGEDCSQAGVQSHETRNEMARDKQLVDLEKYAAKKFNK